MSPVTAIQWTDRSVNPIRAMQDGKIGHHCVKVSPGCTNCYASRIQARLQMPPFEVGKRKGVEVFLDTGRFEEVLRRRIPTKWFWYDMTDLFGEWVPYAWIDWTLAVMALTPHHTHQVLTKRADRMLEYFNSTDLYGRVLRHADTLRRDRPKLGHIAISNPSIFPLPNLWLGVSVESQEYADQRIPLLLQTPAAVRFASYEPALGPIDFAAWLGILDRRAADLTDDPLAASLLQAAMDNGTADAPQMLSWIIVGGESGKGARPFDIERARSTVRQCRDAGVPCFVKQLGARPVVCNMEPGEGWPGGTVPYPEYDEDDEHEPYQGEVEPIELRDSHGGDWSEWPEDLRVRQMPTVPA